MTEARIRHIPAPPFVGPAPFVVPKPPFVIPAQAGIHPAPPAARATGWIPARAGMTDARVRPLPQPLPQPVDQREGAQPPVVPRGHRRRARVFGFGPGLLLLVGIAEPVPAGDRRVVRVLPAGLRDGVGDEALARARHLVRVGRGALVQFGLGRIGPQACGRGLAGDGRQHLVETAGDRLDLLVDGDAVEPGDVGEQQARIEPPPHADQLAAEPHRLLHPVQRAVGQHLAHVFARQHHRRRPRPLT